MTNIILPRSVLEQALEALNASMPHNNDMDGDWPSHIAARRALRAALEPPQVEQEPVAEVIESHVRAGLDGLFTAEVASRERLSVGAELFIHPQPPRQPLTEEQIAELADAHMEAFAQFVGAGEVWFEGEKEFARAVEAAHGIKEQK